MDIPPHWQVIALRQLVVTQKGKKPLKLTPQRFQDSVPYLDIEALETAIVRQHADPYSTVISSDNDVLVVWDGTRCGLCFKARHGAVGSTIMCLTPLVIDCDFLVSYIQSKYTLINNASTGATGIHHVDSEMFFSLKVPVPPVEEQKEIVAFLKDSISEYERQMKESESELLKNLKKLLNGADGLKEIYSLTDFKRAVLDLGVTGKLTEDLRGKYASKLPTSKLGYQFPPDWKFIFSNHVFELVTSGSRGWAKYYSEKGALFIRIGNLSRNSLQLNLSKEKMIFVAIPDNEEGVRTKLQKSDILISITGDIGLIGFVEDDISSGYINQHIALARPREEYSAKFLAFCLLSGFGNSQLLSKKTGAIKAGLGLTDINEIIFPIPSIQEQEAIAERIDVLFMQAEQIQKKYSEELRERKELHKAILELAFEGKAVIPSMSQEPLSDLLQRINLEKERKEQSIKDSKISARKKINSLQMKLDSPQLREYIQLHYSDKVFEPGELLVDLAIKDYDQFKDLLFSLMQEKINESDSEPFLEPVYDTNHRILKIKIKK